MRYVLLLLTLFILAGCETEAPKTAAVISKERAIAIAIEASKNPEFTQVTRSTWRADSTAGHRSGTRTGSGGGAAVGDA